MAKRLGDDVRRYAVVGAEQRLLELAEEAAQIFAIFPELRAPGRGFMASRGGKSGSSGPAPKQNGRRRRRTMSADARKRISEAQKARWARQKSNSAKKKYRPTVARVCPHALTEEPRLRPVSFVRPGALVGASSPSSRPARAQT